MKHLLNISPSCAMSNKTAKLNLWQYNPEISDNKTNKEFFDKMEYIRKHKTPGKREYKELIYKSTEQLQQVSLLFSITCIFCILYVGHLDLQNYRLLSIVSFYFILFLCILLYTHFLEIRSKINCYLNKTLLKFSQI